MVRDRAVIACGLAGVESGLKAGPKNTDSAITATDHWSTRRINAGLAWFPTLTVSARSLYVTNNFSLLPTARYS